MLNCNFDIKHISTIPVFYREMHNFAPDIFTPSHARNIKWNKKDITIGNSSIFWKQWKEKGIVFIEDVLDTDSTSITLENI